MRTGIDSVSKVFSKSDDNWKSKAQKYEDHLQKQGMKTMHWNSVYTYGVMGVRR